MSIFVLDNCKKITVMEKCFVMRQEMFRALYKGKPYCNNIFICTKEANCDLSAYMKVIYQYKPVSIMYCVEEVAI